MSKEKDLQKQLTTLEHYCESLRYVLSHVIGDPIREIAYICEEVKKGDEIEHPLDQIEHAAKQAMNRLNLLKQYAVLLKHKKEPQPIDLSTIILNAETLLSDLIKENKAIIEFELKQKCMVAGHAELLVKCFSAIIDNAIRYAGDNPPTITISITEGKEQYKHHWVVSIEDKGIGIENIFHSLIFNPFQRLDPESPIPGEGMGLAFAKAIIDLHHGHIWYESDEETGSTFFVALPI